MCIPDVYKRWLFVEEGSSEYEQGRENIHFIKIMNKKTITFAMNHV